MMTNQRIENELLHEAIEVIHQETGLKINLLEKETANYWQKVDAVVELQETAVQLFVEVKKWARNTNTGALIHHMNNLKELGDTLLITEYVNPVLAERLKDNKIQFLDIVGNAYINQKPTYIFIKGNKAKTDHTYKHKAGKAFQGKGLNILYTFLTKPEMLNATHREIAERAQVGLGTVGIIIKDLIAHDNFITHGKNKHNELNNHKKLLHKWVAAYPSYIKTKQETQLYTTEDANWWKNIDIGKFNGLWGGEIAAAKYTKYLNPKHALVYIEKEDKNKLLRTARLRKIAPHEHPDVKIELVKPFIKIEELKGTAPNLAHPLIVYADLIETADPRNLDTANRLYDEYLR